MISGSYIFEVVDTHGIPLPTVLFLLHQKHMKVDWYNFIRCAIERNWNPRGLKSKILEALNEVYGPNQEFGNKIDWCIIDCINRSANRNES